MLNSLSLYFEGCAHLRRMLSQTNSKFCLSKFREHVTEASLICTEFDLLGIQRKAEKVKMLVFLLPARNGSKTVVHRGVGWTTASGVVKGLMNKEDLDLVLFGASPRLRGQSPGQGLDAGVSEPLRSTRARANALILFASMSMQLQERAAFLQ